MSDRINAAIVGLGWWGKTIATLLHDNPRIALTRAVEIDPTAAHWGTQRGLVLSPGVEDVLSDPMIDAVLLCTPHSQHRAQILRAAVARKHVFCEKPLALTAADATECVNACRKAGLVLGIGHERRFEPAILELRQMVERGEIGTLLQVEANFSQDKFLSLPADNWRLSGKDAPAGPMTATGIHLLDLAISFLGPVERAVASVRQLGSTLVNGDTLAVLLQFRSGSHALIGAMLATPFCGRFCVYGSKGWVEIVDKAHPEQSEGWTMTVAKRGQRRIVREFPPAPAVRANLEAFAEAVLGRAPYPVSDADLVRTVAALEAVARSAAHGGTIELVP